MPAAHSIFISYRRSDSDDVTGRIRDRLKAHFGAEAVFIDYDDIPYGADFPEHLQQTVDGAKILLAIIGPTWLAVLKERMNQPQKDWVRSEIERALSQDLLVIPVLVNGAQVPDKDELPEGLQALPRNNVAKARAGIDFEADLERLITRLEELVGKSKSMPLMGELDGIRLQPDPELPMFEQVKLEALEAHKAFLIKKFQAASNQRKTLLSDADKVTVQAQIETIEREIQQVDGDITDLLKASGVSH